MRNMNKDIKPIILIAIFALALSLPFLNKAYHIDDAAFIYVADQIAKDPLRPYSFILEWGSKSGLATHILDTPLVSYYIALITWLFGRSEIILHLSFIIFPVTAGISFYFIAKKLIRWPLTATLIMLSTAIFLVSSQNLMLDIPMLSLFLLAFALFTEGVDGGNHKLLFFGSFIAGAAYLAKPNAIFIIPLLLFYCFLKKKPRYMIYQLIPIAFIILFAVHNYYFEDRILIREYVPFLYGAKGNSIKVIIAYLFSNLSYIGGATIFTPFLLYPFVLKRKNALLLPVSILVSFISSLMLYKSSSGFVSGQYSLLQISLFFIFTLSSLFFILLVLAENYANAKSGISSLLHFKNIKYDANKLFIFAWFIEMLAVNSIISGGAAKYDTLLLPPFILSYFSIFEKHKKQPKSNPGRLLAFILFFTLLTGIAAAYADYQYANSYRSFSNEAPKNYKTANNIVHFVGGGGFQYYMNEKGYRMLLVNDNSPKKGDVIIKARISFPRKMAPELTKRLELIGTVSYNSKIPVRTQNPAAHAGFYTYGGGFLPYSFSSASLENFDIYRVKA